MQSDEEEFAKEVENNVNGLRNASTFKSLSGQWLEESVKYKYCYNFRWLGRPIIQYPQDIVALQEIIWETKPELIIETGVARGGSVIFYASILELRGGEGHVIGIDIDVREHNRKTIEADRLSRRISLMDGSSISPSIVSEVTKLARNKRTMVVLDSNHTHEHVLAELYAYAPLVSEGCYLVVLDTIIEDLPPEFSSDRPWGISNNPRSAVKEFLQQTSRFVLDDVYPDKLLISVAPGGYLRCVGN